MSRQRTMEKILSSEYVTIGELVRLTDVRYSTLKSDKAYKGPPRPGKDDTGGKGAAEKTAGRL